MMPLRPFSFFWGVAGAATIALFLLTGAELHHRGRWKSPLWRKLFLAGVSFLVLLGFPPSTFLALPKAAWAEPVKQALQAAEETTGGKAVLALWETAEAIASGKRGEYPFSREEARKLFDTFAAAPLWIQKLVSQGLLSAPEGELLVIELGNLQAEVSRYRSTDMVGAECYFIGPQFDDLSPVRDSLSRLKARLPILERIIPHSLSAFTAQKVLVRIQRDLTKVGRIPEANDQRPLDEQERQAVAGRVAQLLDSVAPAPVIIPSTSLGRIDFEILEYRTETDPITGRSTLHRAGWVIDGPGTILRFQVAEAFPPGRTDSTPPGDGGQASLNLPVFGQTLPPRMVRRGQLLARYGPDLQQVGTLSAQEAAEWNQLAGKVDPQAMQSFWVGGSPDLTKGSSFFVLCYGSEEKTDRYHQIVLFAQSADQMLINGSPQARELLQRLVDAERRWPLRLPDRCREQVEKSGDGNRTPPMPPGE